MAGRGWLQSVFRQGGTGNERIGPSRAGLTDN